jgi:SPP1 gp7 family putative phage head morphogenesis protein
VAGDDDEGIPADPNKFPEAIKKFRARVPMTRAEWDKLSQGQRERAFMVSEVSLADLVTEVYEAVDAAVAGGTSFEEFKTATKAKLVEHWGGEKPGRLETIFRTNVQTAYNGGRHAILSAPEVKRFRPYWRFDGIDDERQTEICDECDGTILAANDPWWTTHHPPLHYNCRSVPTPLSEEEALAEGVDDPPPNNPQDGFGTPPSVEGDDWEPDLTEYPEEIRQELRKRVNEAPDLGPIDEPPGPTGKPKSPERPTAPPPEHYSPTLPVKEPVPAPPLAAPDEPVRFKDTGGVADFLNANRSAFKKAAGHVQHALAQPDAAGVEKVISENLKDVGGNTVLGLYNSSTKAVHLAPEIATALVKAIRRGFRTSADMDTSRVMLHEMMHGLSHRYTFKRGWGYDDARAGIEEATTELLAQHYNAPFVEKVLGAKVLHHNDTPLFEGAPGPRGTVAATRPVAYMREVEGFASMVAYVDELDVLGMSGRELADHIAGRALQVKALPGDDVAPGDSPRWGMFSSAILKRNSVATDHPKAAAMGREISEALAATWIRADYRTTGHTLDKTIAGIIKKHGGGGKQK